MAAEPPESPATAPRPRVLFISADPVGEEMAGLGIRYWELARALSPHADVTIAHGGTLSGDAGAVRALPFVPHRPHALRAPIAAADVVVAHPQWPLVMRWLRQARARTIVDLYDPETLETLELLAGRSPHVRRQLTATTLDRLHDALRSGHHFMCASEKQRDLWLGAMLALRLLGPQLYDRDPTLRSVIDVVPFGVPEEAPRAVPGRGPRELIEAIGDDTELVLWNGGIWAWLDAPTAVRAVAALASRRPRLRLLFMGGSGDVAAAGAAAQARRVAGELDVLGSIVHFHDQWVPYAERASWLLAADCALCTYGDHLETRFAFRTRVLDCFWAGLPVVCTGGDDLAQRVERDGLGAVAAAGDVNATARALEHVLKRGRGAYAGALALAAADHAWSRVARAPLHWATSPAGHGRLGDQPGALRPGVAQRARELAYRAGGRALLSRRRTAG
jgi:glycosyltransferase involved in cell wall biosynthesis